MRRNIISIAVAIFIAFLSWAIPYYLEVNQVITPDNSYWLLIGSGIGAIVVVFILIWGFWHKITRIRFQTPIKLQGDKTNNHELEPTVSPHNYNAEAYIKGRLIYLMDLLAPGAKPIITNRTIEDCELRGPAMVALLGRVTLTDSTFDGDINSLFVEVADDQMILGAIGLQDCVFRRCRFNLIGIIGTREQIEKAKQGFAPSTSRKEDSAAKDNPKLPSSPELDIIYMNSAVSIENDVRIIAIKAEYRPTGKMQIEQVELRLIGSRIPSLDWEILEPSQDMWFSPTTKFELPAGISPGEHHAELFAFANGEWWGPYPFTIPVPAVKL